MINTPRTHLRPIAATDNEAVFSYRSDAATNQYQGWVTPSIAAVDQFIAKNPTSFNQPDTWFQLVIVNRATETVIGDVGVHFIGDQQCELGVTLAKAYQGQHFTREALAGVIDHLFVKLNKHRITTSIDPRNTASIKLVERLGFRKEAHHQQSLFFNGAWVDDLVYALLRSEWK